MVIRLMEIYKRKVNATKKKSIEGEREQENSTTG